MYTRFFACDRPLCALPSASISESLSSCWISCIMGGKREWNNKKKPSRWNNLRALQLSLVEQAVECVDAAPDVLDPTRGKSTSKEEEKRELCSKISVLSLLCHLISKGPLKIRRNGPSCAAFLRCHSLRLLLVLTFPEKFFHVLAGFFCSLSDSDAVPVCYAQPA